LSPDRSQRLQNVIGPIQSLVNLSHLLSPGFSRDLFTVSRKVFGSFRTNSYLLNFGSTQLLVDPASDRQDLVSWTKSSCATPNPNIFLTHRHFDHTMGVPGVCDAFPNAAIYASEADVPLLTDPHLNLSELEKCPFTISGDLNRLQFVNGHDSLDFEGNELGVIALPGHTSASIGLHGSAQKAGFVGDGLFREAIASTEFELPNDEQLKAYERKTDWSPEGHSDLPGPWQADNDRIRGRREHLYLWRFNGRWETAVDTICHPGVRRPQD
jgi:glyoxylase-like metal-dependent hydrolase (beta-lactamase superfamily II)